MLEPAYPPTRRRRLRTANAWPTPGPSWHSSSARARNAPASSASPTSSTTCCWPCIPTRKTIPAWPWWPTSSHYGATAPPNSSTEPSSPATSGARRTTRTAAADSCISPGKPSKTSMPSASRSSPTSPTLSRRWRGRRRARHRRPANHRLRDGRSSGRPPPHEVLSALVAVRVTDGAVRRTRSLLAARSQGARQPIRGM